MSFNGLVHSVDFLEYSETFKGREWEGLVIRSFNISQQQLLELSSNSVAWLWSEIHHYFLQIIWSFLWAFSSSLKRYWEEWTEHTDYFSSGLFQFPLYVKNDFPSQGHIHRNWVFDKFHMIINLKMYFNGMGMSHWAIHIWCKLLLDTYYEPEAIIGTCVSLWIKETTLFPIWILGSTRGNDSNQKICKYNTSLKNDTW